MQTDLEHDVPTVHPQHLKSDLLPVGNGTTSWYVKPPTALAISPLYLCWCTALDITFGIIGLVLLLLILPVLALLIYVDSPGPIFYRQERLGYGGKKFYMFKFRSMHTDAGNLVWTTKSEPRVTRIGRFMRAIHLDELPQVLNILHGDMSLIGPRPEQEEFASELEKVDPLYHCRLAVKPGLTGWAQVMYGYGETSQEELIKLHYDLYYIEHRSCLLDIRILLKTIVEVVLCHGT